MNEREWVLTVTERLLPELLTGSDLSLSAIAGRRLSYGTEVHEYSGSDRSDVGSVDYETDLMICENRPEGRWVPRVVIECKLGRITTHDALTYAAKAVAHRHVHPYLRYGMLIGGREHYAIPGRAVRHGSEFDFIATWKAEVPDGEEWRIFVELIRDEVLASCTIQELMRESRLPGRKRYTVLQRKLCLG